MKGYRVGRPKIEEKRLIAICDGPEYGRLAMRQTKKLQRYAIESFESQRVKGPWRRSEVSPPRYTKSFVVKKTDGNRFRLVNTDPGSHWIEYGAHAGGVTFVLKYKPMRNAIDRLEAEEAAR